MLGAEGPRTYLVLFQNNAEVRATGGIPGAFATITADDGRIALGAQGVRPTSACSRSPLPLTEEELALFQEKMGLFAQNELHPRLPAHRRAGPRHVGVEGGALRRRGRLHRPGGAPTSSAAPGRSGSGQGRPHRGQRRPAAAQRDLPRAARPAAAEPLLRTGRLARSSRRSRPARATRPPCSTGWPRRRQRVPAPGVVGRRGGAAAARRDRAQRPSPGPGAAPYVGVFLNDGTGAKMQYYLDHEVEVLPTGCNSEGRQRLRVSVRLRSTAPANARELPVSVIGPGFGAAPGAMRMSVFLYAPIGGWIDASTVDGQEAPRGARPPGPPGRRARWTSPRARSAPCRTTWSAAPTSSLPRPCASLPACTAPAWARSAPRSATDPASTQTRVNAL